MEREDNNGSVGLAIGYEIILNMSFYRRTAMGMSEDIAFLNS